MMHGQKNIRTKQVEPLGDTWS